MVWYPVLAQEAASVLGYEQVVFYPYASEILVSVEQFEVEVFLAMAF